MIRKILSIFFLLLAFEAYIHADEYLQPSKFAVSQCGLSFEEHETDVRFYLFWNQVIKNHYFYELRAWGGRNFVSSASLADVPESKIRNQYLYGFSGLLGYIFNINSRVFLLPFFRFDAFRNQVSAYKDSLGNAENTISYTTFLALKIHMTVNDVFSIYGIYYGGYSRTNLYGKGVFATPGKKAHINALVSIFELGSTYFINSSWFATPYIQFQITDNNPNHAASGSPHHISSLTTARVIWAIRCGYTF